MHLFPLEICFKIFYSNSAASSEEFTIKYLTEESYTSSSNVRKTIYKGYSFGLKVQYSFFLFLTNKLSVPELNINIQHTVKSFILSFIDIPAKLLYWFVYSLEKGGLGTSALN